MNEVQIGNQPKIGKYKYQIEFETIETNVQGIVESITNTLQSHLAGSLAKAPKITFSIFEEDQKIK